MTCRWLKRVVRGYVVPVLVGLASWSNGPDIAFAGESGAVEKPASPAPHVDPEARRLYQQALVHFKGGEYDEAIAKLEAAHRIAPAAELLYDLGQAYRRIGDCKKALDYYRRFLDSNPAGLARERAQARLTEMEACAGVDTGRPAPVARPEIAEDSPTVRAGTVSQAPPTLIVLPGPSTVAQLNVEARPAKPLAQAPGWWRRHRLPLLVSAAAIVLASVSGYLAWRSHRASERMSGLFERGDTWTSAEAENESNGPWQERAAVGTGVLALAGGAIAAWLFWRE